MKKEVKIKGSITSDYKSPIYDPSAPIDVKIPGIEPGIWNMARHPRINVKKSGQQMVRVYLQRILIK